MNSPVLYKHLLQFIGIILFGFLLYSLGSGEYNDGYQKGTLDGEYKAYAEDPGATVTQETPVINYMGGGTGSLYIDKEVCVSGKTYATIPCPKN